MFLFFFKGLQTLLTEGADVLCASRGNSKSYFIISKHSRSLFSVRSSSTTQIKIAIYFLWCCLEIFMSSFQACNIAHASRTGPMLIAKDFPMFPHWKQLSFLHDLLLFRIKMLSLFFPAMLLQFKPHYIRLHFPNMYTEFRKLNCTLTKEASTIYGYSSRLDDVLSVVNNR